MRALYGAGLVIVAAGGVPAAMPLEGAVATGPARTGQPDPTLAGRLACRGGDRNALTLRRRLELAGRLAPASLGGAGGIALYPGLPASDLPAPELQGLAARYFAQGLALSYGFNHAAAIRSFRKAQQADPDCALCYWGEAMAHGPNINAAMGAGDGEAALRALARARALAPAASPVVRGLIAAQAARYEAQGHGGAGQGQAGRADLDRAYAGAMQDLATRFAQSDDLAVLAAEAAMNTRPWDYWQAPGTPYPEIAWAIGRVEEVMRRNPRHAQAGHLYIHLMEASAPEKAQDAADRLASGAAPAQLGHLVHMPSHIYYRVGRYADSLRANIAAVRADEAYLAQAGDDGLYRYGYYPHNVHFLLTSAQMVGDMGRVMTEAARLTRLLDVETARRVPWVQAIHAAPAFAIAQFGSVEAILASTETPSPLPYPEAMRHYARATAAAQAGDRVAFAGHLAALQEAGRSPPIAQMAGEGFPAPDLLRLAALVAEARWQHWQGSLARAVTLYDEAEVVEARIAYNEPPYWYYPVAQSRGAALYASGQFAAAREAFRKALFMAPNDGWALYGLARSEARLGNRRGAEAAGAALARNWLGDPQWLTMARL